MRVKFLLLLTGLLFLCPCLALAQSGGYINPHVRMDGTYVPGRYPGQQSGNIYLRQRQDIERINPYTGQVGFQNPYSNYDVSSPQTTYPQYYNSIYDYNYPY